MATGALHPGPSAFPAKSLPRLQTALRIVAVLFGVFFTIAFLMSATSTHAPGLLYEMFGWGSVGDAEEMMLSIIYVVWAFFLWIAARDPLRHRLFIDFTLIANAAHFLVMMVQAIVMEGEHTHLIGDVPLGFLLVIVLTALWLPLRREAARNATGSTPRTA